MNEQHEWMITCGDRDRTHVMYSQGRPSQKPFSINRNTISSQKPPEQFRQPIEYRTEHGHIRHALIIILDRENTQVGSDCFRSPISGDFRLDNGEKFMCADEGDVKAGELFEKVQHER